MSTYELIMALAITYEVFIIFGLETAISRGRFE